MFYLLLFSGLLLSAVAAYFSVTGLAAIFTGAFISVLIMGTVLEASKLVVASWIYRRWSDISIAFKCYLCTALVVLMGITSLGIYGYLSAAYLEQSAPSALTSNQISFIETRITQEQSDIDRATKALNQLDSQVDRFIESGSVSRSTQLRNKQKEERQLLRQEIDSSIKEIDNLNLELLPLKNQNSVVEAKVGPLKYFAKLIQGEDFDIDQAVQTVILLLIFVFDPLAVILLMAANKEQMLRVTEKREPEEEKYDLDYLFTSGELANTKIEKSEPPESDSEEIVEDKPSNEEQEELPVETKTYEETKNRFTNLENKARIISENLISDEIIDNVKEESNEQKYRFRHESGRKQ